MKSKTGTAPRVVLLNGGSSSGKTTLARELQTSLPGVWLRLGIDTLVAACPPSLLSPDGLDVAADGTVTSGPEFTKAELHWMAALARIAELGGNIVIEDNFVSGPASQQRWSHALRNVDVRWIGVHCPPAVAQRREKSRGDRPAGMAADQAERVHVGIYYDFEVDTETRSVTENAAAIRRQFFDSA